MGQVLAGPGVGIGNLRDLSRAALAKLSVLTQMVMEELGEDHPTTSIGQNADGSLFFTAVTTSVHSPARIRWAFITRDGDPYPFTGYEDESAVREACRIAPWDIGQMIEALGSDDVDVKAVKV